jgi:hypothetical protein
MIDSAKNNFILFVKCLKILQFFEHLQSKIAKSIILAHNNFLEKN